ncbi:hypothetical protein O3G_MSEX012222 [Manduca sexta]|uniref:Gustatory receptor 39 n=1 Tax=Manduca sexta TaxID=7130 RepID=A0A5K8B1E5_MANSE|nr:hypothetical protein O3G_MSEX012222 [Manduca sexta]CUQ99379.1 TPA: Gustatory receptor 39 [Manduca sexta]
MPDQLACDINFYLYTRFFVGFYHKFQTSTPVRWLARLYCWLICASITFCYNLLVYDHIMSKMLVWILTMEYIMYELISLLKSNKYLLQYYKKTPLIDASPSNYRPMRICLVGYICIMFLMRLYSFINNLILHGERSVADHLYGLIDYIMSFIGIIGRSSVLFVFALLYSRVRLMRQTLESNDFDCRILGKHHPRRYIQMYEAIMDGLEACDGTQDREEIPKLFLFLKRNLFQYSLWRVVPLNVRSLLSFYSFTVTTIIAILQIQSWNT